MTYKILSCGVSKPSARILRDALTEITGKRILVTKQTDGDGYDSSRYIMRYGHNGTVPTKLTLNGDGVVGFNTPGVIHLCASKLAFSRLMEENGIYSPVYHSSGVPTEYPVMIRQSLCSYGGRGIVVVVNEEEFRREWQHSYYWTPFIQMPFEYRVHVLGGQCGKIFKKVKDDGTEEIANPVRNVGGGYHFSLRLASTFVGARLEPIVEAVHRALRGDYYALDIGWDRTNQKYFVMEANSAPGLNTRTAKLYAEYLATKLFS